jgi:toxin ParE1/3/4
MAVQKPAVASRLALRDIDEASDDCLREAGVDVTLRFIAALERAFALIARQPRIGSPRLAADLQIPELRSWPLTGFPYLILYIEHEDAVDIVRVLHGSRDIPATLIADQAP